MSTVARTREPPTIITFGKREIISSGQFNVPLVADRLITEGVNEWVSVSDIAKFAYGKSFLANNKRVRGKIWFVRRELIRRGFLLITEGRPVEHMKIYVEGSLHEQQLAEFILRQMRTRTDISADLYEKATSLLHTARIA